MTLEALRMSLARRPAHFSPFFVLGDPTPEVSFDLCESAVRAGASMLELGIAYSDPVADGPAVQAAGLRARGTDVDGALALITRLHERCGVPMNLLLYGNLVHARGARRLAGELREAGASSVLVPDVPHEEAEVLAAVVREEGLGWVPFCGPATPTERVAELVAPGDGFLYVAGRQGITGASEALPPGVAGAIGRIAGASALPVCVGFGLSRPGQLARVFAAGASVAVVGSALCNVIESHVRGGAPKHELVAAVTKACEELAAAADGVRIESIEERETC